MEHSAAANAHHGPPTWLTQIPFLPHDHHYAHVNGAVLLLLFFIVIGVIANRRLKRGMEAYIVPDRKASIVGLVDLLVESLYSMVHGILGKDAEKHFAFIASLFVFVWFSNLLGLLPLSHTPSAEMSTTFALGICSFIYFNLQGIKAHGLIGYMKHFLMGLGFMGVFIAAFELLSLALRPVTLALRLRLNMHIDHLLAGAFFDLFKWLLPVPLLLFGIVVCTIQAFLFAVLNSVYIQMATEHEDHGEGDHHH
jgi:F-type H+-transporting ATPase subunit a